MENAYQSAIDQMYLDNPGEAQPAVETPVAATPQDTPQLETKEPAKETTTVVIEPVKEPSFNEAEYLKTKFGVESADDLKARLQPQTPQFANETSQRLYEAFLNGKEDEVADYLNKKQLAKAVDGKSEEELIKAHLKYMYPNFDDEDIENELEAKYGIDELLDDKMQRTAKKKVNAQKTADAIAAKEYFAKMAEAATLPTFEQPVQQPTPEMVKAFQYAKELNNSNSDLQYEFTDEQVNIKGQVKIPEERLTAIKSQLGGHYDSFIEARYVKPDGTWDEEKSIADAYLLTNTQEVLKATVADAVHQARLQWMKGNKNFQEPAPSGDFSPNADEAARQQYEQTFMRGGKRSLMSLLGS